MEAFIGSGVLAALGGLAWLAYEHPDDFRKLSWVAAVICTLAIWGVIVWNQAAAETAILALKAAPHDGEAVSKATQAAQVDYRPFVIAGFGLPAYMIFLELFVGKLKRNSKRRLDEEKDQK